MYKLPAIGTSPVLSLTLDASASLLVIGGESKVVSLWDLPPVAPGLAEPTAPRAPVASFRCASVVHSAVSYTHLTLPTICSV